MIFLYKNIIYFAQIHPSTPIISIHPQVSFLHSRPVHIYDSVYLHKNLSLPLRSCCILLYVRCSSYIDFLVNDTILIFIVIE